MLSAAHQLQRARPATSAAPPPSTAQRAGPSHARLVQPAGVAAPPRGRGAGRTAQRATSGAAATQGGASTSQPDNDFASDPRPVILFDGVCNLCNGGVNFMLDWDTEGAYRLAALQSNAGRRLLVRVGRAADDISSIVLVEPGRGYIKSEAVLRIASRLAIPLRMLGALGQPVPLPIRDALYDQIANNRYTIFGRSSSCRLSDARFEERFISE